MKYVDNIIGYVKHIYNYLKALPEEKKNGIKGIIFLIAIALCAFNFISSSTLKSWSQTYEKISTPLSSYLMGAPLVDFPVMPAKGGKYAYVSVPFIQTAGLPTGEKSSVSLYHNNSLIKLLCLGNRETLGYLNMAYVQGQYISPYILFVYGRQANYESKFLPAPAILLYNFSWLLNIPGKFLSDIDQQLQHSEHPYTGESAMWIFLIDDIISLIFATFVDIPTCLCNTVVGFFTSLVHHPLQSLIAIPGSLYFCIVTMINAIWVVVSNIVLILIHLF